MKSLNLTERQITLLQVAIIGEVAKLEAYKKEAKDGGETKAELQKQIDEQKEIFDLTR